MKLPLFFFFFFFFFFLLSPLSAFSLPRNKGVLIKRINKSSFNRQVLTKLKNAEEKSNEEGNEQQEQPRMGVVAFDVSDFQRKDIYIAKSPPAKREEELKQEQEKKRNDEIEDRRRKSSSSSSWVEDPSRPTGYGRDDDDKLDDENWVPTLDSDPNTDTQFVKLFKDLYVDNSYDTRKKKQAKYVIRNITFFSISIGIIFTTIWFAFPGKFISYRGERDFNNRYETVFVDPSDLLENDNKFMEQQEDKYFDNADGLPLKEQTRFPFEKSKFQLPLAPPPSESL